MGSLQHYNGTYEFEGAPEERSELLSTFWDPFGVILGLLGTFCPSLRGQSGLFRNILGLFGAFWDSLGTFWNLLGAIMDPLRSMWGHFGSGALWTLLEPIWITWDHFGAILGPFWGYFGTILGLFWDPLGSFGTDWVPFGIILEHSGPFFG